ncbi:NAD(P)H-dependent FMN reductase [Branchiibius hedensis]|uniref:NAD(P)H-dependent FMN reductase n=1 Tax=Branchiibius hedensis TaxID=672460 RepID=A0A2Y8ZTV3_9MICO|nr:NAD(P)H-dependent oxidoreductase [Branchiibius hedensis]PWJ26513.1 NAD(P)H-dependent FMN reductase [Branchiibius hedensis]SSA35325.1 NAD(P)H-dependent FMN reductase [Branchiibius hedensis]
MYQREEVTNNDALWILRRPLDWTHVFERSTSCQVSTRPGRIGGPIADWFVEAAREQGGFEVDPVDLAELDLPMMNEPNHPRLQQYTHDHTKAWAARVEHADAFVFVTPEYNFGMTAPLKNALDYLQKEWAYKPASFVSYGGVSGGLRAVQMAKQVITTLGMYATPQQVIIPFAMKQVEGGVFTPNDEQAASATIVLDELLKLTDALKPLRS